MLTAHSRVAPCDGVTRLWSFSDPQDKRALPNSSFKGFGRCGTDKSGAYTFRTGLLRARHRRALAPQSGK